jgi:hypothetical protein
MFWDVSATSDLSSRKLMPPDVAFLNRKRQLQPGRIPDL